MSFRCNLNEPASCVCVRVFVFNTNPNEPLFTHIVYMSMNGIFLTDKNKIFTILLETVNRAVHSNLIIQQNV